MEYVLRVSGTRKGTVRFKDKDAEDEEGFLFFFWLKTFFKIARERRCEEEKGFDLGMELDDEELGLSFSWLKVLNTYEFLKNLRKI